MVKHQQRTHSRSDNGSKSDAGTGNHMWADGTPVTYEAPPLQRAASYNGYTQPSEDYMNAEEIMILTQRHSVSAGRPSHGEGFCEPMQQGQPPQNPGVQMMRQPSNIAPHSYYVTERNNPGVATMNTAQVPYHEQQLSYHVTHQVPRQQPDQHGLSIPYQGTNAAGPNMNDPNRAIPNETSVGYNGRSPSVHSPGEMYTHLPPASYSESPTYQVYSQNPLNQALEVCRRQDPRGAHLISVSQPQVTRMPQAQYVQQVPQMHQTHQTPQMHQAPHVTQVSQGPQANQISQPQQIQGAYSPPPTQGNEQWNRGMPYQEPVDAGTIHGLPSYGNEMYLWDVKPIVDDPSLQMPSDRINELNNL
ncbi:hypothetical protein Hte_003704 [Hypoxylon texense]